MLCAVRPGVQARAQLPLPAAQLLAGGGLQSHGGEQGGAAAGRVRGEPAPVAAHGAM